MKKILSTGKFCESVALLQTNIFLRMALPIKNFHHFFAKQNTVNMFSDFYCKHVFRFFLRDFTALSTNSGFSELTSPLNN
jgi:hypothetical protein